jgi:hypothetical protein
MNIVEVNNNWNPKTLRIELSLGNVCNYRCWYCFPGCNSGNFKFPNIDLLKTNIPHLIQHYRQHLGKEVFEFEFVGGEPTHWPKLLEFIKFLKENFNCLITMTTNGSKKLEWWNEASKYFDRVTLSCHYQYVDIVEFRKVADLLYDNGVMVSSSVIMDPANWDQCMGLVNYLKKSRNRWTIRYADIIGHNISYSQAQTKILKKYRARRPNPLWFWKNNKYYISKVKIKDDQGKSHKLNENELILKSLNRFDGWKCNIGLDWIVVNMQGELTGNCGQKLFGLNKNFNLYQETFVSDFAPLLAASICDRYSCNCTLESNMKKVIPIYEH